MRIRIVSLVAPGFALVMAVGACGQNTSPAAAEPVDAVDAATGDQTTQPSGRRPQTLASMQSRTAAMFERMDADKDDVITSAELAAASEAGGRGGRALARADADGDGNITREEARAQATTRFERMDANGDGTVTDDERPRRRGAMAEPEA